MAAVCVEEDLAVQAARILLTLRNRKLLRWPEWVPKEPATAVVEVRLPPGTWPKRPRSGGRLRGDWRADSPAYCSVLAGSGPSTSADSKAQPRHAVEKSVKASASSVSASTKEPMKASSPETPLDFGASAAGSGASSSGDDAVRPPSKRRAAEATGSGGGASSGDEGCSSPDKRARVAAGDGDGDGEKAISEPKMQAPDESKKAVKFEFDLNMPPEDEECPGFC